MQVPDPRQDRGAAYQRQRLVPLDVVQRAPAERLRTARSSRRDRGSRRGAGRAAIRVVDSSVVNHATSCSGAPIDAMSQSSTASGARSSPKITLPNRTSPHSSTGSDSRAGRCARHHASASTSAGTRRAAARPVEVVGPEVELGLVVARGNAGRGGEIGAMRRRDRADERLVHLARAALGEREQPRVEGRDLADDVAAHPRHHDERRAEPLRVGDELGRRDRRRRPPRPRAARSSAARGRSRGTCRRSAARGARRTRASLRRARPARSTRTVSLEYPIDGCSALTTRTSPAPVARAVQRASAVPTTSGSRCVRSAMPNLSRTVTFVTWQL